MSRNRPDRKFVRRQSAESRKEAWEALTPEQQIAQLDARLGEGVGAKKQRTRIAKRIAKAKVKS